jgi:hypothetical protein
MDSILIQDLDDRVTEIEEGGVAPVVTDGVTILGNGTSASQLKAIGVDSEDTVNKLSAKVMAGQLNIVRGDAVGLEVGSIGLNSGTKVTGNLTVQGQRSESVLFDGLPLYLKKMKVATYGNDIATVRFVDRVESDQKNRSAWIKSWERDDPDPSGNVVTTAVDVLSVTARKGGEVSEICLKNETPPDPNGIKLTSSLAVGELGIGASVAQTGGGVISVTVGSDALGTVTDQVVVNWHGKVKLTLDGGGITMDLDGAAFNVTRAGMIAFTGASLDTPFTWNGKSVMVNEDPPSSQVDQ